MGIGIVGDDRALALSRPSVWDLGFGIQVFSEPHPLRARWPEKVEA